MKKLFKIFAVAMAFGFAAVMMGCQNANDPAATVPEESSSGNVLLGKWSYFLSSYRMRYTFADSTYTVYYAGNGVTATGDYTYTDSTIELGDLSFTSYTSAGKDWTSSLNDTIKAQMLAYFSDVPGTYEYSISGTTLTLTKDGTSTEYSKEK